MDYFEQRERSLLGEKFEQYYTYAPQIYRGITCNTLKCNPNELNNLFAMQKSEFCEDAFVITDNTAKLGRHPYHHAGAYYVQEPSAAAPAALLDVQKEDIVLDMCAAPGGKTQQLAAKLQGTGLIIANEYVYSRALILRGNIERMGIKNAVVTCANTSDLAKNFGGFFNKILVDAPCSGEGMFRKESEAIKQHSEALVNSCAQTASEILQNAATCLSKGGKIVFSTCTFSPEENELQIYNFLRKNPDFTLVDCNVNYGVRAEQNRANGTEIDVTKARRIYPCHKGEGHFVAVLQKDENNANKTIFTIKDMQMPVQCKNFILQYFPALINSRIINIKEKIIILPKIGLPKTGALNIVSAGVMAGKIINDRFEPEHSLFMAYWRDCINIEALQLDDARVESWLRGEEIAALTATKGYCAVTVNGLPLGFGKVSEGKCKNHYPKGLRNLK